MSAFLKLDTCKECGRNLPWEWVPTVCVTGRSLAGTGVWRSQLTTGKCAACLEATERRRHSERDAMRRRAALVEVLGGEKPYQAFTLDRYRVGPGNKLAFDSVKEFNPATDNIYLWGPCGVGKTHLAWAAARQSFDETLSVAVVRAWQLSRRVRMREPEQERLAIEELVKVETLVIDDLATGSDSPFSRMILLEILEARDFQQRAGLVVTSKYSLDDLAQKMEDDSIPSRLAGLCSVIRVNGPDARLPNTRAV